MMTTAAVLDRTLITRWRAAWTQVMGGFVPGLGALEEAVCRATEAVHGRAPGRVLDLGGGPGVLAERMARRWPGAAVALMDIDPVLLTLARQALGEGVRALDGDLSSPDWVSRAGAGHDLVTAVMTLHYLPAARVRACYAEARRTLAPGGLFVVADLMPEDGLPSVMSALDPAPDEAAAELAWVQWWNDLAATRALRPLLAERAALLRQPPAEFTAPVSWHVTAAREAGFGEAGIIWRSGRHAALAAVA
jgi:trans-aconitate methyltransferase